MDFGDDVLQGYGIPYNILLQRPALLPVSYGTDGADYQSESDWYSSAGVKYDGNSATPWPASFMPWPQGAAIEGWQGSPATDPAGGDRHILQVDTTTCTLMESWNSVRLLNGFMVSNTAVFNMSRVINGQRPDTWTSGDAAGLPIFPTLLKWEEVAAGAINHALRFTVPDAQAAFIHPATHYGPSNKQNTSFPPYGSRYRLKASFNVASFSPNAQTFLNALKKYGLIFQDQGSAVYVSGTTHQNFTAFISEINGAQFKFTNFEMVQSPYPVQRYNSSAPAICNGMSSNPTTYVPTWVPPTCDGTQGVALVIPQIAISTGSGVSSIATTFMSASTLVATANMAIFSP